MDNDTVFDRNHDPADLDKLYDRLIRRECDPMVREKVMSWLWVRVVVEDSDSD